MSTLTVPRAIVALEYKALRYPATLLETKVVAARLPEESAIRLGFERLLGRLDSTAGKLLADEDLATRGRVLLRRTEVLEKAVELEAKAAERKQQADAALRAKTEQTKRKKAEVEAEHQREAARLKAERAAEQKAIDDKAAARQRTDESVITDKTERIIREERDRLDAAQAKIEAHVQTQTAAPKAELKQAAAEKAQATGLKNDADRLAELREAKKAAKKTG
jgi:hypothetical protein